MATVLPLSIVRAIGDTTPTAGSSITLTLIEDLFPEYALTEGSFLIARLTTEAVSGVSVDADVDDCTGVSFDDCTGLSVDVDDCTDVGIDVDDCTGISVDVDD